MEKSNKGGKVQHTQQWSPKLDKVPSLRYNYGEFGSTFCFSQFRKEFGLDRVHLIH